MTGTTDHGEYRRRAQAWALDLAARSAPAGEHGVAAELARMHAAGLLLLPAPGANFHRQLLDGLSWIGYGSLALGRLVEGHLNALMLVARYGTPGQWQSAQRLAAEGRLFGVWNTGEAEPVRLEREQEPQQSPPPTLDSSAPSSGTQPTFQMRGRKTFGSGAGIVQRPIVTADLPGAGWQMTLVPMERATLRIDRESWNPVGMRESFSFDVDFTGTELAETDLIGAPNDFYREPAFSGGAVRFAAVHAGGARRLLQEWKQWLRSRDRGKDPHQAMRLATCVQLFQEILLWTRLAGETADELFDATAPHDAAHMVHVADMTRTAVERNTAEMMRLVTVGVGAHGMLQPNPFGPLLCDLTMYLRQPAPDRIAMRIAEYALAQDSTPCVG